MEKLQFSIVITQERKQRNVLDENGKVKDKKEFIEVHYYLHNDFVNDIEFLPLTKTYKNGAKNSNKDLIKSFAQVVKKQ